MKSKIFFDHAYTVDTHHKFLEKLSRLGFTVSKDVVSHPGSICCFIKFETKPYLEFIHNPSRKFPGISFGCEGELKDLNRSYLKKGLSTNLTHRNYNWDENNIDHLPGWNFLDFNNRGFGTFYPWFTEYEARPNKKRKLSVQSHKNKVSGVIGHEFVLNSKGFDFFKRVLGGSVRSKFVLSNENVIHLREGETNYYSKVILRSKNLDKTAKFMSGQKFESFDGEDSILIENPSEDKRMWDIVIV